MIEKHKIFKNEKRGPKQAPAAHQLMVLLKFLGTEGSGGSNLDLRNLFKIGRGSAENYKQRAAIAILSLKGRYYNWPDQEEQKLIANRMLNDYGIPNCVMIVDGTMNELFFQPETEDAADYSGQKYKYALSTLIFNDNKKRIRYYLAGWPGSAHDNRIVWNSKIYKDPNSYLSEIEYIIGDSAFEPMPFLVPVFKKSPNESLTPLKEYFNSVISKPRVTSENTIGIWKGRFPWLRKIRMKVNKNKNSLKRILAFIEVTVILHNFLIDENDVIPDDWIDDEDDASSDDETVSESNNILNQPVPKNAKKDLRQKQILAYLVNKL